MEAWFDLKDNSMARQKIKVKETHKPARPGSGGKLANDHNKQGLQAPEQKNEPRRTPLSRGDRDTQLGADNQSRERKGRLRGGGTGR